MLLACKGHIEAAHSKNLIVGCGRLWSVLGMIFFLFNPFSSFYQKQPKYTCIVLELSLFDSVLIITSGVEQNTQTNVAFRYFHTKSTKYIHLYILYVIYRVYGIQLHFQQYFSYILAVSFIGGGNWSNQKKNHRPVTSH